MMTSSQPLPHTGLNYIGSLHYTQTGFSNQYRNLPNVHAV